MRAVVDRFARLFGVDPESFEVKWNGFLAAVTGASFLIVSALLSEPVFTASVQKKTAIWGLVGVGTLFFATKPKMVLVAAMLFTSIRWFFTALMIRSALAFVVALSIAGVAWLIIRIDPVGTGFYQRHKE